MDIKYISIYNEIVDKIENKEIKSNSKLPSESELMKKYSVSRDTIRKSLNLLEQDGYIQKRKGMGSFVLDRNIIDFSVSGLTSFKELSKSLGDQRRTIVEALEVITPNHFLMKNLEIKEENEVWKVIRVREIDGSRIILDKDFLNKTYVPQLTEEICKDSIYEYLEGVLELKIAFAKKEIVAQKCTQEDKRYLDMEDFNMVIVVKNYVYLEDMTLFQYTESRHRPDKFRFVDFARRKRL